MSDPTDTTGSEGERSRQRSDALPFAELPANSSRRSLWLLLVPAVLYGLAPVVANSIEPRILGVPFLLAWILGATVASPIVIWLVARLDPAYRTGAVEPLPADRTDDAGRDAAGTDANEGQAR